MSDRELVRLRAVAERSAVEALLRYRDLSPRVRERAEMVRAVALGHPPDAIARWTGRSEPTVRRWLARFAAEGLAALSDAPRSGRPPKADALYHAVLERALAAGPGALGLPFDCWTSGRLSVYMHEQTGVRLAPASLRVVLAQRAHTCCGQLGRSPRHRLDLAWPAARATSPPVSSTNGGNHPGVARPAPGRVEVSAAPSNTGPALAVAGGESAGVPTATGAPELVPPATGPLEYVASAHPLPLPGSNGAAAARHGQLEQGEPEPHRSQQEVLDGATSTCRPPEPVVRIFCFGSFELHVGGVPIDGCRPGKALSLLQYLINHRERPSSREALIEVLWPDPEALAAGTSLKVAVHAVRQTISQACTDPDALAVRAHPTGYQFEARSLWVDVEEFERRCATARRLDAAGRRAEAGAEYEQAAALYRGEFLRDAWDDWVLPRREGLKDQYLLILAHVADAAFAAGDYQACILRCQQALAEDACCEETYQVLMRCHARLGQRGRVRAWYEVCQRTLRRVLDLAPDAETERVYQQALRTAAPEGGASGANGH